MGLAGRKEKQRIPNDPRNLSWADDANKFGAAYLQKLGWSAGTGLGTSGDGRTSHIKVHQKLDMLGIGAAHQKDPNGLAWKQNKDFENLLRRLNAANGDGEVEEATLKIDGFSKATEEAVAEVDSSKKRKRSTDEEQVKIDEAEETREERKKRKKEEKEKRKKEKKERKARAAEGASEEKAGTPEPQAPPPPKPAVGRPVRAHRARFMASKNIAAKSSAAIDEILGISRSGTATPYPTTSIPETPAESSSSATPPKDDGLKLQELTTSSKSVMDYFKEKLLAKSNSASSSSSSLTSTSSSTPRDADEELDDYDDRPRGGLGLGFGSGSSKTSLGASRLRSEVTFEQDAEVTTRSGLGAFSRMSTMFSSAMITENSLESTAESVEVKVVEETAVVEDAGIEGGERKKKKTDKGKKRDESSALIGQEGKKKKKRIRVTDESETPAEDKPAKEAKVAKKEKTRKIHGEGAADEGGESLKKRSRKSKKVKSSEYVDDEDS